MARLRVKEVAEQRGMNLSSLQRKADIAMRTARRYWYNTRDGNVKGQRLEEISLKVLAQVAAVLGVPTSELITDEERRTRRLVSCRPAANRRAWDEAAEMVGAASAPRP